MMESYEASPSFSTEMDLVDMDPEKIKDRLPQPYRMIDKILRTCIIEKAWSIVAPSGKNLFADADRRFAKLKKCTPSRFVTNCGPLTAAPRRPKGNYSVVGNEIGDLCVVDAHSDRPMFTIEAFPGTEEYGGVMAVSELVTYRSSSGTHMLVCAAGLTATVQESKPGQKSNDTVDDGAEADGDMPVETTHYVYNQCIVKVYELILQKRKSRVIAQVKLGNTQVQSLTMSNSGQFLAVNQRGLGRPFQVFPVPLHLCEGAEEEYSDGDDGKAEATDNAEDEPKSKLGQTMDMTERALLSIDGDARPFFIEAPAGVRRSGGSEAMETQLIVCWMGSNEIIRLRLMYPSGLDFFSSKHGTDGNRPGTAKGVRAGLKSAKGKKPLTSHSTRGKDEGQAEVGNDLVQLESRQFVHSVISACAINESGSLFAVGSVDGSVVVWSTHVFLDVFWSEKCHSCTVTSVTIFQETYALSGAEDGSVQVYNIDPQWSPGDNDGNAATAVADWEVTGTGIGRLISKIEGDGSEITQAMCMPEMHLTFVCNQSGRIYVYELDTGRCIGALVVDLKKQDGFKSPPIVSIAQNTITVALKEGRQNDFSLLEADEDEGPARNLAIFFVWDIFSMYFPAIDGALRQFILADKQLHAKDFYMLASPAQRRDVTVRLQLGPLGFGGNDSGAGRRGGGSALADLMRTKGGPGGGGTSPSASSRMGGFGSKQGNNTARSANSGFGTSDMISSASHSVIDSDNLTARSSQGGLHGGQHTGRSNAGSVGSTNAGNRLGGRRERDAVGSLGTGSRARSKRAGPRAMHGGGNTVVLQASTNSASVTKLPEYRVPAELAAGFMKMRMGGEGLRKQQQRMEKMHSRRTNLLDMFSAR